MEIPIKPVMIKARQIGTARTFVEAAQAAIAAGYKVDPNHPGLGLYGIVEAPNRFIVCPNKGPSA